jgi:hypothetical protein
MGKSKLYFWTRPSLDSSIPTSRAHILDTYTLSLARSIDQVNFKFPAVCAHLQSAALRFVKMVLLHQLQSRFWNLPRASRMLLAVVGAFFVLVLLYGRRNLQEVPIKVIKQHMQVAVGFHPERTACDRTK